jgi:hypothetical protein
MGDVLLYLISLLLAQLPVPFVLHYQVLWGILGSP